MRIAFINHDLGPYGATKSLIDLIEGLSSLGVSCYVIIPKKHPFLKEGPLAEQLEERNIPYQAIDYRQWMHKVYPKKITKLKQFVMHFPNNRIYRLYKNIRAIPQIRAQIKRWNVDVIYTNTSVIPVGAITALLMKKPHIWHIREFQRLDHGLELDWGREIFRRIINKSAAVIMVSHAIKRYYNSIVEASRSYVVYNGVASKFDFDTVKQRKDQFIRSSRDSYTFCILGRISQKGQVEAIKALEHLAQAGTKAQLIIAGRGDYQLLDNLATRLNLKGRVVFVGHVDDSFSIYLQSDACLVCSPHEAFGRVTIEAMVAGLPVIGKKNLNSGTHELIHDGHTGLLYEGDEFELSKAMKRLVENPEWGKMLGRNGWEYAREHYNREKYVDQVYEILKKVCNQ